MKILVTGAAGFIGFHLTKRLLERGDEVVGLDCINDYYDVRLKYGRLAEVGIAQDKIGYGTFTLSTCYSKYRFIQLKLEDRDALQHLFETEKFDKVCNLAAQAGVRYSIENPYAYINSNIIGFINLLEWCRHYPVQHLVYASSSSVYGANAKVPFSEEDKVDNPVSLYAATKKSNELMAHVYSHLYKIPTTGLRFFTVYGPWGRPDMSPILLLPSVRSITTLLFALPSFSLPTALANPIPMAVPSSIMPYSTLLKRFIRAVWSLVSGHCVKLSPANTTRPTLSFGRPEINSIATSFAASRRLGRKSSASIVPDMSSATIMSIPSVVSLRKLLLS